MFEVVFGYFFCGLCAIVCCGGVRVFVQFVMAEYIVTDHVGMGDG